MPRAVNGAYTLPAGNPVVAGTTISTGWANPTLADVAQEITNSLDRSGRGGMLAPFRGIDGAVNSPAVSFTNEPTSGIYRTASGKISFSVGSTEIMRWLSTGVKIGASSDPTEKLDVTGNGVFTGSISAGVRASSTIAASTATQAAYEARGINADVGSAAFIAFHRLGQYAVNFGLDTDNKLKVGGWTMGAVAREIWHEGNLPANGLWGWRGVIANPDTLTGQTPGPNGDLNVGSYRWETGFGFSDHVIQSYAGGSTSHVQLAFHYGSTNFRFRTRQDGGTWNSWREVWHDGNFTPSNYYTSAQVETRLTDVVTYANGTFAPLSGSGASGTWGIDISGTAAAASSVAWGNVSGRPTDLGSFTNGPGYLVTANFPVTIATGGTVALPNGLYFKWGEVVVPNTGDNAISWANGAFPNSCLQAVASYGYAFATNADGGVGVKDLTAAGCNIRSSFSGATVRYFAIGY